MEVLYSSLFVIKTFTIFILHMLDSQSVEYTEITKLKGVTSNWKIGQSLIT